MKKIKISHKTNIFLLTSLLSSLLFFSFFLLPFKGTPIGDIQNSMANIVGVSAGVPTNPYNTLNQQLEDKKNELSKREQEIADYESFLMSQVDSVEIVNGVAVTGASVSGILFALVGVNFYWDHKRNKLTYRLMKVKNKG